VKRSIRDNRRLKAANIDTSKGRKTKLFVILIFIDTFLLLCTYGNNQLQPVVANHPPVAATPSTHDRSITMHANLMVTRGVHGD
jgi:hypothetical protein